MSNMKITIEVEKNFLEITNADGATAAVAVRSFCNMLKTRQPTQAKIVLSPKVNEIEKVEELAENPDDRIPVSAVDLKPKDPATLTDAQCNDGPAYAKITNQELHGLKRALENREEMVLIDGLPNVIETIRFTDTEPKIPLYRSSYFCPACGNKGKRYVREINHYLKCHNCESQLVILKTVPNSEFLESNEEGYFFHASELAGRYNNNISQ